MNGKFLEVSFTTQYKKYLPDKSISNTVALKHTKTRINVLTHLRDWECSQAKRKAQRLMDIMFK